MIKLNKFFAALLIAAIVILFVIGIYEIFMKPPEYQVNTRVENIQTYFGEDVLNAISR